MIIDHWKREYLLWGAGILITLAVGYYFWKQSAKNSAAQNQQSAAALAMIASQLGSGYSPSYAATSPYLGAAAVDAGVYPGATSTTTASAGTGTAGSASGNSGSTGSGFSQILAAILAGQQNQASQASSGSQLTAFENSLTNTYQSQISGLNTQLSQAQQAAQQATAQASTYQGQIAAMQQNYLNTLQGFVGDLNTAIGKATGPYSAGHALGLVMPHVVSLKQTVQSDITALQNQTLAASSPTLGTA